PARRDRLPGLRLGGYISRGMPGTGLSRSVRGVIRPLSRTALIVDIVVAAVMFAVLTPFGFPAYSAWWMLGEPFHTLMVLAIVASAALMCAGVAVSRLAPGLALSLAWAGALVQMIGSLPPLPVDLAILVVLFATAAWG